MRPQYVQNMVDTKDIQGLLDTGFPLLAEQVAEEAVKEHNSEMDDQGFYALHPFSASCEGIWEHDSVMWFTHESFYQAQQDV